MGVNTESSSSDNSQQDIQKMDIACKKLLSQRKILARILKECVSEFSDISLTEIEQNCILDIDNEGQSPQIIGLRNEDNTEETAVFYDILFLAKAPKGNETIKLFINIEAQGDPNPGYPLIKRGLYYCCRMISGQYGKTFDHSNYQNITKVYSIWISINPPKYKENTLTRYRIIEEDMIGNVKEAAENYDLMTVIMIGLTSEQKNAKQGIFRMLSVLLSEAITTKTKEQILKEEYDLDIDETIRKESNEMCNIGEAIAQKYLDKGRMMGLIKGREEGKLEGQNQGKRETSIIVAKRMLNAMKYTLDEIAVISGLSPEEIKELQI